MSNSNQATKNSNTPVYTVNIYLAVAGTPITKDMQTTRSTAGHMYYSIDNGTEKNGYGFAPIISGIYRAGHVVKDEYLNYQKPLYTRTLEITQEQYNKLKEFGDAGLDGEKKYFDLQYNAATNSCIDFTWGALNHAGLHANLTLKKIVGRNINPMLNPVIKKHVDELLEKLDDSSLPEAPPQKEFDGKLKIMENIPDVKSIKAPFPNSIHNDEKTNKRPEQNLLDKALSENTVQDQTQHQASLSTNKPEQDIDCMFEALCTAAMNNDVDTARAIGDAYAQSKDGQEFFQQGAEFNQKQAEQQIQQEQEQTLLAQQQAANSASKMKI